MTTDQIGIELSKRYNYKEKQAGLNDILRELKNYTETQQDDIFQHIIRNNTYTPMLPNLFATIKELKIQGKSSPSKYKYYYRCNVCRIGYNMKSRGCPKCKKQTPHTVCGSERSYPADILFMQEDCYRCTKYHDKLVSAVCEHFGKDAPIDSSSIQMCASCECRECCTINRRVNRGEKIDIGRHKEFMNNFETNIKGKKA